MHASQTALASTSAYRPASQSTHAAEPVVVDARPGPQASQWAAFDPAAVPAEQRTQATLPVPAAALPASQTSHAGEAGMAENEPEGHATHWVSPLRDVSPAEHAVHEALPLSVEIRPAGQIWQALAPEVTPIPSSSSALSVAYEPAGHESQWDAPWSSAKRPLGHGRQSDSLTAPISAVTRPGGHDSQTSRSHVKSWPPPSTMTEHSPY
mmetsp:Transcript_107407/g.312308  ORF Transcript_107407/g.312308 Transcript_107407/m.312308 type:complete len:209 (-) Transcript_107407:1309-1935(-)